MCKKNFGCVGNNYFLFIAYDGYRVILAGRGIFLTEDGESMVLINKVHGKNPIGNNMPASIKDFYVNWDVQGLSHIMIIDPAKDMK